MRTENMLRGKFLQLKKKKKSNSAWLYSTNIIWNVRLSCNSVTHLLRQEENYCLYVIMSILPLTPTYSLRYLSFLFSNWLIREDYQGNLIREWSDTLATRNQAIHNTCSRGNLGWNDEWLLHHQIRIPTSIKSSRGSGTWHFKLSGSKAFLAGALVTECTQQNLSFPVASG